MPAHSPFTSLCQRVAGVPRLGRADLHIHTTASDGCFSAKQVVELAAAAGLSAFAITDHDTLASNAVARTLCRNLEMEFVPGVELTAEHDGKEMHILGLFVDESHAPLRDAIETMRDRRAQRFSTMVERLRDLGIHLEEDCPSRPQGNTATLGRPHLARMLVAAGRASTVREAFVRYLHDGSDIVVPKVRLPLGEALSILRGAGGVTSWAHPPESSTLELLCNFRELGLDGIEAEYPGWRRWRKTRMREWASELGMIVTGGSDCHGPGKRAIGSTTITDEEWQALREYAARRANR